MWKTRIVSKEPSTATYALTTRIRRRQVLPKRPYLSTELHIVTHHYIAKLSNSTVYDLPETVSDLEGTKQDKYIKSKSSSLNPIRRTEERDRHLVSYLHIKILITCLLQYVHQTGCNRQDEPLACRCDASKACYLNYTRFEKLIETEEASLLKITSNTSLAKCRGTVGL